VTPSVLNYGVGGVVGVPTMQNLPGVMIDMWYGQIIYTQGVYHVPRCVGINPAPSFGRKSGIGFTKPRLNPQKTSAHLEKRASRRINTFMGRTILKENRYRNRWGATPEIQKIQKQIGVRWVWGGLNRQKKT